MIWKEFVSVFAQQFLAVVLPVLFASLAGLVIAWIKKTVDQIKANMDDRLEWALDTAVKMAVFAAEQVKLRDALIDKKNYALEIAESYLAERGFKIDLKLLDAAIEAEVMKQFNKDLPAVKGAG